MLVHEQTIRALNINGHPDGPLLPHDLGTAWNLAPSIWIPILLTILIYAWGVRNVWQRAGRGHGIIKRQWLSFMSAILMLAAVVSDFQLAFLWALEKRSETLQKDQYSTSLKLKQ